MKGRTCLPILPITKVLGVLVYLHSTIGPATASGDGHLDTTFGAGGKIITSLTGANDSASAIAIQSDGKIAVGGRAVTSSSPSFALARYNTDGSLDSAFGDGGAVTTSFPATSLPLQQP
jgi:uncharacterized delta-60 repeat protein